MIRESAPLLRVIFKRPVEKTPLSTAACGRLKKASSLAQRQNSRRQQPYLFPKPLKRKTENALSTEQPPLHQNHLFIYFI